MIPKKFYQTWKTKNLHGEVREIIDKMLDQNPSYGYELYDDSDMFYFIKENYGKDVLKAYEELQIGAAKADLWRYLVLYKNGGVYLDIDSEIYANLDNLLKEDDQAVLSRETNIGLFVQWCLMFDKNHPILEKTIVDCILNIRKKDTDDILRITGPHVFSKAVKSLNEKYLTNIQPSYIKDVHRTKDRLVNPAIQLKFPEKLKYKLFFFDYAGYANFKHSKGDFLYTNDIIPWREENKFKSVFKDKSEDLSFI